MIAILSDIHGNLEALQAVLADAEQEGAEAVYCLGDVIGYGPNPRECLDLAQRFRVTLLGNHDQAAMLDPFDFSPLAERALYWTRDELESGPEEERARERRWEFLAERPASHKENGYLFVHGSARNPLHEYVFPEDVDNRRKLERIFALVGHCCFEGHTHVPGVFLEEAPDGAYRFYAPHEVAYHHQLDARKALVNVGSVGQPREGDWRACYVLLDGDTIHFRRVEYDVSATVKKVHAVPGLDRVLGDRLREGK